MSNLTCIETYIDNDQNHYGAFVIEPLEIGQGITLGNALRRTILSDLSGYAISGVRINNIKHEFSMIEGLREDVLEILLNLKEVLFKHSFAIHEETLSSKLIGFLHVKGPLIVTAGMFRLPKEKLILMNPNQYICTLVDNSEFYLEIDIEYGKGYKLNEEIQKDLQQQNSFFGKQPATLFIDALFIPIKKVNYKTKLIHDSQGNIKESLTIEILTNGTISPKRALQESLKILLNLVSSLFQTFLMTSMTKMKSISS